MKKIFLIIALSMATCLSYAGTDNCAPQFQTKKTPDTICIKDVKSFGKDSSHVLKEYHSIRYQGNPNVLIPVDTTQNVDFSEN